MPLRRLAARISHPFQRPDLLERAVTHRSAGGDHNERLEFLGDSILSFVIADELFRRFADAREGELTRLRARLVRSATLASLARGIGLGETLRLGSGELKSGGRDRDSILADALEALIGAVYLDAGIDRCRELVLDLYADLLGGLEPGGVAKDPKTRLQEWLQARRLPLPCYAVSSVGGDAHEQRFTVTCEVETLGLVAQGEGSSRRGAEQVAAERLLARLHDSRRAGAASTAGTDGPDPASGPTEA
jgi:ribonuclease-3